MGKKYKLLLAVAPLVIIIDQIVKIYVESSMHLHQSIEVLENFFHFTYIRNRGAAFGILSGADSAFRVPFFLAVSAIAIATIIYMIHRYEGRSGLFPAALALILGGAIGNMIDRIRLGEVIDFIDIHWYRHHWPAFNIADSAITIGIGLLIIQMLIEKEKA